MVPSTFSHSLTRPSYFGPVRPKFSSQGHAAWAGLPKANTARRAARARVFKEMAKSRMCNPEKGSPTGWPDRAPLPLRGQVQHGNTSQQLCAKPVGRSFHGPRRTLEWGERNGVSDAKDIGR